MKAKVDENKCIGCGLCEQICPAVFKVVDGLSKVQTNPVPPDQEDDCQEAADSCPVTAITVEE